MELNWKFQMAWFVEALIEKPGNIKDENNGAGPVYVGPCKLLDRAQNFFGIYKL